MSKGKLIVIEGIDGTGKATQVDLLRLKLLEKNLPCISIDYPRYDKPYSIFEKMYLNGDFGKDATTISPYKATTFYALDRYADYMVHWKDIYEKDGIIIANRYTTSNIIFQPAKLEYPDDRAECEQWIENFEYNILGLPIPDLVLFMNIKPNISSKLVDDRGNKKDIHETNANYQELAYSTGYMKALRDPTWRLINCTDENGTLLNPRDIHKNILTEVKSIIDISI